MLRFCVILCCIFQGVFTLQDHGPIQLTPGYTVEELEHEMQTQDTDFHRPCAVTDVLCIRTYLAQHSNCEVATGPVPNPIFIQQRNIYLPFVNMSITETNVYKDGLNGTVSEFYVNRNSGLTVLAIDFKNITESAHLNNRFYRKAQEPLLAKAYRVLTLPYTITTTVFRGVDHLDLANSETTWAFPIAPVLKLSSESEPVAVAEIGKALAKETITQVMTEAGLTLAPRFAAIFIQFSVCDFGINID